MKIKLLLVTLLISSLGFSQNISAGQTSNFSSGTQGWKHQISNAFEPVQVATGGPAGAGDAFLRTTNSSASGGSGSKHAVINDDAEWTGNYTAAGIVAITFDVQNPGTETLHLRVAFNKSFPNWAASTTPMVIAPGTGWTTVTMPVTAADLTVSQGPESAANILLDVDQIRIVSNDGTDPTQAIHKGQGAGVVYQSDYDNITAVDVLSVSEVQSEPTFEISPNPAKNNLNIKLANTMTNANVSIYDILGKKVYSKSLSRVNTSIDVSKWNAGVYLVRISTDSQTLTKRFVKQ